MEKRILKKTVSLCPSTFDKIPAEVICSSSGIYMEKKGLEGSLYRERLDMPGSYYEKVCEESCRPRPFNKIMIDLTTECNLECPVCYRSSNSQEDIPIATIRELSSRYRGYVVSLCGGEPTVRSDLLEIIKLFSKYNTVFLITNGISLADPEYVDKLKKSGLRYLSFSFNGFSDDVYKKINGRGLLKEKLAALENLKRAGLKVILSVLLARSVNEEEIRAILEYSLENQDFIREVRIRSMAPLGKYLKTDKYSISEMIGMVCARSGIQIEDLYREFYVKRSINRTYGSEVFPLRSCSFDFHIARDDSGMFAVGRRIAPLLTDPVKERNDNILITARMLMGMYGISMIMSGLSKVIFRKNKRPWIHDRGLMKIGLRSWPDVYDIDMEEILKCETGYYMNGEIIPFCYANILKNRGDQSENKGRPSSSSASSSSSE